VFGLFDLGVLAFAVIVMHLLMQVLLRLLKPSKVRLRMRDYVERN